jgi:hypothetical protein
MKTKPLNTLIALIALIAATMSPTATMANEEKPMSAEETKAFFTGEVGGKDAMWTVRMKFDGGTVYGNNQNGGSDVGSYAVEADGKICIKWRGRWNDYCGQVTKLPDGSVRQLVPDSGSRMTFTKSWTRRP